MARSAAGGPGIHPFKEAFVLIRITWGLVLLGLGLVIGGFLSDDSNVLLILAIAVEIAAIVLVLASWARRAREATEAAASDELAYASDDTDQTQEEELFAALESDEEFAVGGRRAAPRPATRPARKSSGSSPARKSTAKAKPSAAARKPAAKSGAKSTAKKPAKAKPASKAKPKAKGTTGRPKATQPRRRPPTASP
jgi:FtsZ-interacting cell division protein ZipA